MRENLKSYIDLLFAGAPHATDIKQEILQNTLDRYDDLIDQGKTPEAAYQLAISGIGDINEILGTCTPEVPVSTSVTSDETQKKPVWKKVLTAVGICLYILCPIPLFILQNELGLCGLLTIVAVATALMIISDGKDEPHTEKSSWKKVVKGIIIAFLIIALVGALTTGIGFALYATDFDSSHYTSSSSAEISPDAVRNMEIEWASGTVYIAAADVDTIVFSESGTSVESQPMLWTQEGDTLVIHYSAPTFMNFSDKDLTVLFPRDWTCGELELDVASADATVEELFADKVSMDTASGTCNFFNCTVLDFDADTASGNVRFEGAVYALDYDAASGKFDGVFKNGPARLSMESASGDMKIVVPIEFGFRASLETASGDFVCDLPTSFDGHYYTYGDGSGEFEFESASGDVSIKGAE